MTDPYWFPDWRGKIAVVAASGPSLKREDLETAAADGCAVIVIKGAWSYLPTAPICYACDWQWWRTHGPHEADFKGIRVRGSTPTSQEAWRTKDFELHRALKPHPMRVQAAQHTSPDGTPAPLRFDDDWLFNGGNSAAQAANLAARLGATRIILAGVDCNAPESRAPNMPVARPDRSPQKTTTVKIWLKGWQAMAPQFAARGIEVINISAESAVKCFPKKSLAAALR